MRLISDNILLHCGTLLIMELYQFKNLLDQVKAISQRYEKINELTGENFNVFKILKLESSEVRMHSAFLAELLNPNGSHGQKDSFLKLFIKQFCFKENLIDTLSCKLKIEEKIGSINEDRTQGGRIDIIITDRNNYQIIIENKINAGDQKHQLIRYYNHSNQADLIYLTLDGRSPSDDSKGVLEEDVHYKCYSYKYEILEWLEQCQKEVAIYPLIREALTHYINLIKHLTNQTINHNMQEEVSDLLKSHIEASWVISSNLNAACQKIADDFGKEIIKEFEMLGLICSYEIDFKKRYSGIFIWKTEWEHLSIAFQFQRFDKELIYGYVQEDSSKSAIPEDLRNKIKLLPNNTPKDNPWWPWFKTLEDPFNNWNELEAWQAILDGRMKSVLIEKTNHLLTLSKDLKM